MEKPSSVPSPDFRNFVKTIETGKSTPLEHILFECLQSFDHDFFEVVKHYRSDFKNTNTPVSPDIHDETLAINATINEKFSNSIPFENRVPLGENNKISSPHLEATDKIVQFIQFIFSQNQQEQFSVFIQSLETHGYEVLQNLNFTILELYNQFKTKQQNPLHESTDEFYQEEEQQENYEDIGYNAEQNDEYLIEKTEDLSNEPPYKSLDSSDGLQEINMTIATNNGFFEDITAQRFEEFSGFYNSTEYPDLKNCFECTQEEWNILLQNIVPQTYSAYLLPFIRKYKPISRSCILFLLQNNPDHPIWNELENDITTQNTAIPKNLVSIPFSQPSLQDIHDTLFVDYIQHEFTNTQEPCLHKIYKTLLAKSLPFKNCIDALESFVANKQELGAPLQITNIISRNSKIIKIIAHGTETMWEKVKSKILQKKYTDSFSITRN